MREILLQSSLGRT